MAAEAVGDFAITGGAGICRGCEFVFSGLPEIACSIWRRLTRQRRALRPELYSQDNGRLLVWFPHQEGRDYIIGVDSAGGGSQGDYACAEVIERTVGLQCAELRGHFPPLELARRVVELGRSYGLALLAVERNNHGYGVLAHLQDMEYGNIYRDGQAVGMADLGGDASGNDREYGGSVDGAADVIS